MNKQQRSARPQAFLQSVGTGAWPRGTEDTWGHTGVRASHAGRGLLSLLSLSMPPLLQSKACPPCLRLLGVRDRG